MSTAISLNQPSTFFHRMESKLGKVPLRSDSDLARLVEDRLPLEALDALTSHGVTDEEVFTFILPRRTLAHRKTRKESLTHEESDKAVGMARITSLAEQVFGDDEAAAQWLREPKQRFDQRTPFAMLRTESGARLVENMLHQLDHGIFA